MRRSDGPIVALAAGSLIGGPVLGLLLGGLLDALGVPTRSAEHASLAIGALLVWIGQAIAFTSLHRRPDRRVDRLYVTTGVLTVLGPIVLGLVVMAALRRS
jgi:hypothetical protein